MEFFSLLKLRTESRPTSLCLIDDEGPFFDLEFSVPVELKMNTSLTEELIIKEEKKLLYKDVILRYISKIKPLYVKVSKLRFLGPPEKKQKKGKILSTANSFSYRLKVVPGRLRKSRSASSAAVASVCSPPIVTPRHDDSLLQQEDGIQGAIAHCKRSFHSEKGIWVSESPLLRSMSDPGKAIRGENSAVS